VADVAEPGPVRAAFVTADPVSAAALADGLAGPGQGAVVCFEGRVRDRNDGRPVRSLHYEAYEAMAGDVLREIASEAAERYGAEAIAVAHRTGTLVPGEVSVAVAAAAPHRDQAFAAARHAIEEIKRRLPIWKRETYEDGTERWLDGTPPETGEGTGA
jgi:molybdopterin synthase catalytic subunit